VITVVIVRSSETVAPYHINKQRHNPEVPDLRKLLPIILWKSIKLNIINFAWIPCFALSSRNRF